MQSLIDQLKAMIPVETIDGVNVDEAAEMVMLDVEFTPVVVEPFGEDPAFSCLNAAPFPCRVQKDGERYCVWMPHSHETYRWVEEDELKVMRARYLLLKNFYFRTLENMSHSHRAGVIAKFFPGGVFKPAVLMGREGA